MNIISISVILIISAALLAGISLVFMKIYGKGIFCGLRTTIAVSLDKHDDAEAILNRIIDNLGAECECSTVKIIIIDSGMNEYQCKLCQQYCNKYSFFIISAPENIYDNIIKLQKEQ